MPLWRAAVPTGNRVGVRWGSSYYDGQRKFAMGGKGWTLVLGSLISASYLRIKDRIEHEDREQAYHKLQNEKGEPVQFADQSSVPRYDDPLMRFWRSLPPLPMPNLYLVGTVMTVLWAYRVGGTFNRLMVVRYSDISYQLRRPDVLANKVLALKYLALPLALIPAAALLALAVASRASGGVQGFLQGNAQGLRDALAEPCRQARDLAHEAYDPMTDDLNSSPLAEFARRSQTVGREPALRPGFGDIVPGFGKQS